MNKIQTGLLAAAAVLLASAPASTDAQNVILALDSGDCVVPLEADSAVTVATNGDLSLDVDDANLPTCFGTQGSIDVILSITPTSIESGDDVDVSWSVTGFVPGVTNCAATGGISNWVSDVNASPSGGSGTYTLNSTTTFNLSCQNDGDAEATQVTVSGGGTEGDGFPAPPAFCGPEPAGRELPFNIFKDFQSNPPDGAPKINFEEVWDAWPGTNEATIFIPNGNYVAMPFVANLEPGRFWQIGWPGGPSNGNGTTVTVSSCPGDFSGVGYSDSFCEVSAGREGANLLTVISSTAPACTLTQGEIYYLNVRHTDSNGASTCPFSTCQFLGNPSLLN